VSGVCVSVSVSSCLSVGGRWKVWCSDTVAAAAAAAAAYAGCSWRRPSWSPWRHWQPLCLRWLEEKVAGAAVPTWVAISSVRHLHGHVDCDCLCDACSCHGSQERLLRVEQAADAEAEAGR
jgi:hypothetical protein